MQQNVKTSSTCTSYLFAKMLYTCISFFCTNVFYMYFLCVLFAVRYKRPVLVRGRGDDTDPAVPCTCISSVFCLQYGISGPFWYAAGATIQILLFAMISVQLKIRAPGAKTFLRVIRARFGRRTHITFCVFALLTNTIVTAMLTLGKPNMLLYNAPIPHRPRIPRIATN